MGTFALDERLEKDTTFMTALGLCEMRLMRDRRWPWIVLIPKREDVTELFELTPLDQTMATFELGLAAKALKQVTGCTKINVGALGNQVRQLHLHVVARTEDDAAWPGPVWGHGAAVPYAAHDETSLISRILDAL